MNTAGILCRSTLIRNGITPASRWAPAKRVHGSIAPGLARGNKALARWPPDGGHGYSVTVEIYDLWLRQYVTHFYPIRILPRPPSGGRRLAHNVSPGQARGLYIPAPALRAPAITCVRNTAGILCRSTLILNGITPVLRWAPAERVHGSIAPGLARGNKALARWPPDGGHGYSATVEIYDLWLRQYVTHFYPIWIHPRPPSGGRRLVHDVSPGQARGLYIPAPALRVPAITYAMNTAGTFCCNILMRVGITPASRWAPAKRVHGSIAPGTRSAGARDNMREEYRGHPLSQHPDSQWNNTSVAVGARGAGAWFNSPRACPGGIRR